MDRSWNAAIRALVNPTATMATTILAVSGSLQSASANTALVRLAAGLSDECRQVHVFERLAELPYFNPDLDGDDPPHAVAELRASVAAASGLLIASPEYAHEMPGVLKNALDWLVSSGELYAKPVAVLCAAPSADRGIYVREALQRTLTAQGATIVTSSTIAVPPPASRSTAAWSIAARATLRRVLEALVSN
jgi:NAD(P)H-dependent FMN reductase